MYVCMCVCMYMCVCIYIYTHDIFFMHASVNGHLNCFHVLATVNSVAMNIVIHLPFWIIVFFRYMPRSGISGWQAYSIFNILRNLHSVILNGYTTLHSHPQCTRVPFSLHPLKHVLFVDFLTITIWQVWSDLICISLTISTAEHHFMCLLAICKSSLEKCLFRCSAHFLIFFFKLSCMSRTAMTFLLLNILFIFIAV